jgi:hypothetical protein
MEVRVMTALSRNARRSIVLAAAAFALATVAGLATMTASAGQAPAGSSMLIMANHTVSGVVTDSNGSPAANVPVKLLKSGAGKSGPTRRGPNDSPTGDAGIGTPDANQLQQKVGRNEAIYKETKTDSAGKFTLTDVEPGKYSILAGDGKVAVRHELDVKDSADPAPVTIKLLKG